MVDGKETKIISSEIKVGDVLRIYDDEVVPADCILLSSYENMAQQRRSTLNKKTHEKGSSKAFVTTASLDGESALVMKQSFREIDDQFQSNIGSFEESDNLLKFLDGVKVTASAPMKDLYQFEGKIEIPGGKKVQELKMVNFLHRGSKI